LIHMISCIQFVSSSAAGGATGHHNSGSSLCKSFFTTNGKICPSSCNGKKVKRVGEGERRDCFHSIIFEKKIPTLQQLPARYIFLFGSFFFYPLFKGKRYGVQKFAASSANFTKNLKIEYLGPSS